MNLLNAVELHYVDAAEAAGSSIDSDSAIVDTANYEGVVFVTPITDSVATGVATLTIEQNDANSGGGMAALSGAVATATSAENDDLNDKLLIVDVYRPRERYVRSNITSGTANIAFGDTIAILYNGRVGPVAQLAAEVAASTIVASPAEA